MANVSTIAPKSSLDFILLFLIFGIVKLNYFIDWHRATNFTFPIIYTPTQILEYVLLYSPEQ